MHASFYRNAKQSLHKPIKNENYKKNLFFLFFFIQIIRNSMAYRSDIIFLDGDSLLSGFWYFHRSITVPITIFHKWTLALLFSDISECKGYSVCSLNKPIIFWIDIIFSLCYPEIWKKLKIFYKIFLGLKSRPFYNYL